MHYAGTFLNQWILRVALLPLVVCSCSTLPRSTEVSHPATPEAVVRAMFHANETRNMADLERLVSKDPDMVGYSIGGRKYVGWDELKHEMQQEFESVRRLDIPIKEIRVWSAATWRGIRRRLTTSAQREPASMRGKWCCHCGNPACWNAAKVDGCWCSGMNP
jgi:hypothetical protein